MAIQVDSTPYEIAFVQNPILFQFSTVEKTIRTQIYLETFHLSSSFQLITTKDSSVSALGTLDLQIQEHIKPYLTATPPTYGVTGASKLTDRIRRYYIVVTSYDANGSQVAQSTLNNSGNYYRVMMGGISHEEYPTAGFFQNYLPTNKIFLSWQGQSKKVDTTQPEFLHFLATAALSTPYCRVKFYYTDSTTSIGSISVLAMAQYDLLFIPVGYQNVEGLATAGKTIEKYEVYIENYNGSTFDLESEKITFTVDYSTYFAVKYFHYLNSLGGFDTLRTIGISNFDFAYTWLSYEGSLVSNYTPIDGIYHQMDTKERQVNKSNTGFMTMDELDHLRDFMLSEERIFIHKGQYLRVLLISSKLAYKEDEDLYAMEIDYSFNFSNKVYTPDQLRTIQAPTYKRTINASGDTRLINSSDERIYKT